MDYMKIASGELPRLIEIRISGDVDQTSLQQFPNAFEDLIVQLNGKGVTHFLVEVDTLLNAVGFGVLITVYSKMKAAGGDTAFYTSQQRIIDIVRMLKGPYGNWFTARDDALCYLFRERPAQLAR